MGLGGVFDQVNFRYARMCTIHNLTTTKDEDCIADTKKGYIILRWNTRK